MISTGAFRIFSKDETNVLRHNPQGLPALSFHQYAHSSLSIPETTKMMKFLSLFAVAAMLCGCAVYTPSGSVVVDPQVRSDGGFCPPGQAKKGRC
jgi:hypothetical protein